MYSKVVVVVVRTAAVIHSLSLSFKIVLDVSYHKNGAMSRQSTDYLYFIYRFFTLCRLPASHTKNS